MIKYGKIAIGRARTIMESTEILVIIGYSFPFFNRVADRYILEPFLEHKNKTRKIYFQDPNPDAYHNFCGKFNIEDDDEFSKLTVTPITNVDEFHLPFEM